MPYTADGFLKKIKPLVIEDMQKSNILASLTAAQAFIESNKGNSGLTKNGNNLFGIKGKYNGQSVKMLTTEYYNGQPVKVMADFRKYPSWKESIADHSSMFNRLKRYENLRGLKDYNLACKLVKDDGYATSPTYTQTLLKTIEKYKLHEWDIVSPKVLPTLKRGDDNVYVLAWQNYLFTQGYNLKADCKFGPITESCVKDWQKKHGLPDTGIITPVEWNLIGVF